MQWRDLSLLILSHFPFLMKYLYFLDYINFGLKYNSFDDVHTPQFRWKNKTNPDTHLSTAVGFGTRVAADPKCKGFENLLSDLSTMSYGLGLVGTLIGFFTMLISFVTQIQTVLSTYLVGVPSSLVTLNGLLGGDPTGIPTSIANTIGIFTLIDTFVNLTFATNVNGLVNIIDIFGAIFSFTSLYVGAAATFPDTVEYLLKEVIGKDPKIFFASYGCR